YQKTYLHPGHHAGYYPDAESISLKVIFDTASGAILGAQAVGAKGVDKRIDVIAASIAAGRTVFDLEHLELAYAPPYGSAKDPVNMVGFIAGNILRGEHRIIHAEEIGALDPARDMLLDVRTVEENAEGRMPNSINIPINELRGRIGELPRDRRIVVYCAVGQRGYVAQRMLTQMGFDAVNLSGGYATWIMAQAAR
ncbi:MAG TPA: rhodanese-like domain-containing protein, partial [Spirochaetota bacterium]|nr:rhodanese-like domain-containing protein [Spirochaetota bacterium]